MEQASPLQWPAGRPRTPVHKISWSRFNTTESVARAHMMDEISRMGGRNIVLSTNKPTRKDGLPYASAREPDDSGVAVYFERKGERVCFSCDQYMVIWENMRAIGKTIEAMRGIERWGSTETLDRAFTGFTALPPPDQMSIITTPVNRNWWDVLSVQPDCALSVAEAAWKALCRSTSENERYEINAAIEAARKALK
jgi:hypothetical protein